jgi:hypothetical protein
MEHPLIESLENLTPDELLDKISELNRKLGVAYGMNNHWLIQQIRMAIESYQNKYTEKIRKGSNDNFEDVIDIS